MHCSLKFLPVILASAVTALADGPNLLLNPTFEFHSFVNHREGKAVSHTANAVAFWSHDAFGDITVTREAHAKPEVQPRFSTGNMVSIAPGKKFWQFLALPEAGLAHGESVELFAPGWQSQPGALKASIVLLKLDSEDGVWKPSESGMSDTREFPKHARGELVAATNVNASANAAGFVNLHVVPTVIDGRFHRGEKSFTEDRNIIGLKVELENVSTGAEAWVWAPCLSRAGQVAGPLGGVVPSSRIMEPVFKNIPRTMQKLWKGEALHILLMGSSIDRGSANPPMYLYDEDPGSQTFKQPLSDRTFEAGKINRPDLDGYYGWWQHYFSYGGRLRRELMRRFNLPVQKLCLNIMACDGSCVGEASSGLAEYCSLSLPPGENANGHKTGAEWKTLYPELFSRPSGPGPDLVIFGSGANEKTDTPDEVAVFEGTIRWVQKHYPNAEFLFCMFQNAGSYTPNPGDLQALALRYQIPMMDYGRLGDDVTRWCNPRALVPRDGHPQAVGHFLWSHVLQKAFECWDPVPAGVAQLTLPERLHGNTVNWEGELATYASPHPRIRQNKVVLDDTQFNCWASVKGDGALKPFINGVKPENDPRRPSPNRDIRNSAFRWGKGTLGDRQIFELAGEEAAITFIDMKTVDKRRFFPAGHALWKTAAEKEPFESQWGAPCGNASFLLKPGQKAEIVLPATDLSVAYADRENGGTLSVTVNGSERLRVPTQVPFTDQTGKQYYLENRKGIRDLGYGLHRVTLEAVDNPVQILGVFAYDTRPNLRNEKRQSGPAAGGETVLFTPPFKNAPVVRCFGDLHAAAEDITPGSVKFSGAQGSFEAVGE